MNGIREICGGGEVEYEKEDRQQRDDARGADRYFCSSRNFHGGSGNACGSGNKNDHAGQRDEPGT